MEGVVNAISLYLERGPHTFHSVHSGRQRTLRRRRAGPGSAISSTFPASEPTLHRPLRIRSRGEGELAVQAAFRDATIIRPTVMFGPDDGFLNTMLTLLGWVGGHGLGRFAI